MRHDKIISSVSMMFGFMLIPSLLAHDRISPVTSFLTMMGMFVLGVTYLEMRMKLSSISCMFTGLMWMALLIIGVI